MVNVRKAALGILMIGILTVAIAGSGMAAGPPVFINEIHYDNAGADIGEAIEVAGPAGTDLTGWSIVKYNGAHISTYGTNPLLGIIPDQQSGYGTLWFSVPGLQNGYPDGLALVDPSAAVVQFLSYEGSFTAGDGPAAGMTSTDIGVAEDSGTPDGYSLQLVGSGTMAGDFTWAGEQPNTYGSINTGQTFGIVIGLNPGDLVINEIMQDPAIVSDSAGEWFEVYNTTAGSVDLVGLTVSDDDSDSFIIETSVVVAPGGFAVLGNNESSGINGGVIVDYQYFSFFLDNGADEVVILDGAVEINRVSYDGGPNFPDPNGASMALNDTANDNNVGANWCTSSTKLVSAIWAHQGRPTIV